MTQPLPYAVPARQRPGLVTAIAVVSIVIGVLGTLTNLCGTVGSTFGLLTSLLASTNVHVHNTSLSSTTTAAVTTDQMVAWAKAATTPDGRSLNEAQVQSLRAELTARPPSQADLAVYAPAMVVADDGSATVSFGNFGVNLAADGQVTGTWGSGSGPGGGVAIPLVAGPTFASQWAEALLGLVALGLSILLLSAGVLLLRGSDWGIRLHWVFVACKIPLVLIIASVASWAYLTQGGWAAANTPVMRWVLVAAVAGPLLLGLGYPIVLLFLLRSQAVRTYIEMVRSGL